MTEHFDVVIVGAGLSGIGAARHLQARNPGKRFVILEGRSAIGGTWDLFRYPGIRSDSDMYTLGYSFKPWTSPKAIADGASIREYIHDAVREGDLERHIRLGQRVVSASWSSKDARWTLSIDHGAEKERTTLTCGFVFSCTGYYRYEAGFTPEFPGRERFAGRIVHPQHWGADVAYAGKRVVVIGSGATAITLVPELAKEASHVVMLQRSPTYVVSRPTEDPIANALRRALPEQTAYDLTRWKNVLLGLGFFQLARRRPGPVKKRLVEMVKAELAGDSGAKRRGLRGRPEGEGASSSQAKLDSDVATHFTPRYDPWDQRLCLVTDGDLFRSIREGRASVATGQIETFTEKGIRLVSGEELEADLIVTATGLELLFLGGIALEVDGSAIEPNRHLSYKGMMLDGVPNLACAFGYTNASWTLKADLTSEYVCRILDEMDARGATRCTPRRTDPSLTEIPFLDFSSGYVQRALGRFPKQGSKRPWRLYQNYVLDLIALRFGRVDDGVLELDRPSSRRADVPAGARPLTTEPSRG
ncbi:MAG: NAD(P)/FAD-dependent oxidoreductase [Deltaproteobacteria bacterium]|nr:NAD(P)/FAD-dependent oxidoreductase [Deltaproteobacteria bacterium]